MKLLALFLLATALFSAAHSRYLTLIEDGAIIFDIQLDDEAPKDVGSAVASPAAEDGEAEDAISFKSSNKMHCNENKKSKKCRKQKESILDRAMRKAESIFGKLKKIFKKPKGETQQAPLTQQDNSPAPVTAAVQAEPTKEEDNEEEETTTGMEAATEAGEAEDGEDEDASSFKSSRKGKKSKKQSKKQKKRCKGNKKSKKCRKMQKSGGKSKEEKKRKNNSVKSTTLERTPEDVEYKKQSSQRDYPVAEQYPAYQAPQSPMTDSSSPAPVSTAFEENSADSEEHHEEGAEGDAASNAIADASADSEQPDVDEEQN